MGDNLSFLRKLYGFVVFERKKANEPHLLPAVHLL